MTMGRYDPSWALTTMCTIALVREILRWGSLTRFCLILEYRFQVWYRYFLYNKRYAPNTIVCEVYSVWRMCYWKQFRPPTNIDARYYTKDRNIFRATRIIQKVLEIFLFKIFFSILGFFSKRFRSKSKNRRNPIKSSNDPARGHSFCPPRKHTMPPSQSVIVPPNKASNRQAWTIQFDIALISSIQSIVIEHSRDYGK